MATSSTLGRDIACVLDADEQFTEAVGIDVVRQDAIHRITTDDILGDDGTGSFLIVGWGFDCRRLLGLPASRLAAHGPILSEVLTRDPRLRSADVTLTPTRTNGLVDVAIRALCTTVTGQTFSIVKTVLELTGDDLVGAA